MYNTNKSKTSLVVSQLMLLKFLLALRDGKSSPSVKIIVQ